MRLALTRASGTRYHRLVRRMGGEKNPAAKEKAIVAVARTLLKIAYSVLRTGAPLPTAQVSMHLMEDLLTGRVRVSGL